MEEHLLHIDWPNDPEGQEQFRLAKDIRNEAADCKRCEDQRDYLLQFSEFIHICSEEIGQVFVKQCE